MRALTKQEGLALFQKLDAEASRSIEDSRTLLCRAIIALNRIREGGLFTFGGYEDWASYLEDFRKHNGNSRGLVYEDLKVARLAKGAQFTDEDLLEYGIKTIKPYFETGGPVIRYNRRTGEIMEVVPEIVPELPEGDTLGERYGEYVRSRVEAGEPASIVRHRLQGDLGKKKISFMAIYKDMRLNGITWAVEEGNNYVDGTIVFKPLKNIPEDVELEILRLLRIPTEWRE